GTIANPAGLDVARYLAARNEHGEVDRAAVGPGDRQLAREEWLQADAEVLIPAAVADTIHEGNCDQVTAGLVVEAANLPTTGDAAALSRRNAEPDRRLPAMTPFAGR